jgi:hypothetical protein
VFHSGTKKKAQMVVKSWQSPASSAQPFCESAPPAPVALATTKNQGHLQPGSTMINREPQWIADPDKHRCVAFTMDLGHHTLVECSESTL